MTSETDNQSPVKLYPRTDMGLALRFADRFRDRVRYDLTSGRWLALDSGRWSREHGENMAELYVRGVAIDIYNELSAHVNDKDTAKEIFRHWQYASSASGMKNILYVARSEPGMSVTINDLDTHPYLLNVLNGTIDLRTGQLRPHDPADMLTQLAPVEYDPSAASLERWLQCLEEWHPNDPETHAYLQRLMGYCLTGDTSSRCFPIFIGDGKNGKNVFLDTFAQMLGDYATTASRSLLESDGYEHHPAEVADLCRKRLVLISEPKKGSKLKTALVKSMTGDSFLKARWMHGNPFTFTPTHKMIMLTQNLPSVDETSDAIWDRLHKVRWGIRIPKEKQDPKLIEKLRREWPGILRWAIQGCLAWQQDGILHPTPKIEQDTADYRNEQNPPRKFVESVLVLGKHLFILAMDLRVLMDKWNKWNAEDYPLTSKELYSYLKELGCKSTSKTINGLSNRCWVGCGLQSKTKQQEMER